MAEPIFHDPQTDTKVFRLGPEPDAEVPYEIVMPCGLIVITKPLLNRIMHAVNKDR